MAAYGLGHLNGLNGLGGENARISALIGGGGVCQDSHSFNMLSGLKAGSPLLYPLIADLLPTPKRMR